MSSHRKPGQRFRSRHPPGSPSPPPRRPVLELLEGRALLATFTVNSLGDAGSGSGDAGDLGYCINQANADDQANTIVFDPTVFGTPQTITLSGVPLELSDTGGTQTITGPAAGVTVSGGGISRVFQLDKGVTASVSGLTISGGSSSYGNGGGLLNDGTVTLTDCTLSGNTARYGGGLFNSGTADLTGCTLSGNTAYYSAFRTIGYVSAYVNVGTGGGVFNASSAILSLTDCTVSGSSAAGGGGLANFGTANVSDCTFSGNTTSALANFSTANLTMIDSTISGNFGNSGGGGMFNSGTATLTDCTFSGNGPDGVNNAGMADLTGCTSSSNSLGMDNSGTADLIDCTLSSNETALLNDGTANLIDSTVSGNNCGGGEAGGVANYDLAILTGCTVSGNSSGNVAAGGLQNLFAGTVILTDTIVAGNTDYSGQYVPGDISGNVSGTYNLIGTGGSGGLVNGVDGNIVLTSLTNLGLAPLGNFGGPTQTMALLSGSPAIAAGVIADYPGTTTPITTDQRGEPLDTPNPDIGAFQVQGSGLIALTFSGLSNPSINSDIPSVSISGTLANGSQAPVGESVTVTLDGVQQSATIGSGGAFSTSFDTTGLLVANSPYTVDFAYFGDGTFAPASTTSTLTVEPTHTILTVNSLGDAGIGSGDAGDLRYCVNQANADDGVDTIVFDPTVFSTAQTITLSGGQLELSDTGGMQTITAPAAGLTLGGGGSSRVFEIDSGVTASLSGVTISGGSISSGNGGGLANYGTATLTGCTIQGNSAQDSYGAGGGGVFSGEGADLTLTDCTVSGNSADDGGGGLENKGTATLTDCTVSGNTGSYGGGVFENYKAQLSLTGCTVSGNSAATYGGGLDANSYPSSYITVVTDTIVAGNTNPSGASDIGGNASGTYNLIGTGGSGGLANGVDGNIVGVANPLLAPLDNYGGPTQTIALLAGSPALGAGVIVDYPGTTTPITTDQRGLPLDSPNPDIGAFQNQGSPLLGLTFSVSNQSITYGTPSVTISGTLADGAQAPVGETVAVTLDGVEQSATIGPGGAFSTTLDTAGLTVLDSPYTVDYAYAYTSGTSFASASATSKLTVNPTLITLTVDSLGDAGIGSGDAGDLRYCIDQVNADDQSNTIVFDPTVFGTAQTITLSGGTLELENIWGTQTITGPAAGLTLSGGGSSRVFQVDSGVTASITGVTITGGSISSGNGGGLANYGAATLTGCTIQGNSAQDSYGGGVFNAAGANLTLTDCTVSGNSADVYGGGGLGNKGTATLTDCTLSGNTGSYGGGVLNAYTGKLTLTDCTVSGNSATYGGGVFEYLKAQLSLTGCTVSGNSAQGGGGGLYAASYSSSYNTVLTDTIVAGNTDPSGASDIAGRGNVSGNNNLIGTGGSGRLVNGASGNIVLTSLTGLDLAPLGNNGGPTQTMALLPGSPAIGAGVVADYPGTTTPITTDQRGEPLDSSNPDIGAFQTQPPTLTSLTFSGISSQSITYGSTSVTVSGTLANGSQAPVGETVAVTLDHVQQSARIGSGGAFSTTFNADGLTVAGSPDTVKYAYSSDGTFASASTTSTLTVNPATLTITAEPETKVYGADDPAMAYTVSGFQFHDTAGSVLTGSLARTESGTLSGEQAGGYAISQGALAASSNYIISFTGNTLTITPAPLTVTAHAQTKVYGTDDPALTDTATGLVDTTADGVTIDDTAATALAGDLARTPGEPVSGGPYAITQGTLAASNYTITFTGSTLAITPAPLTVTANPQTKVYGTADPTLTDTATGFVDTTVDGVTIDDTAATALTGHLARTSGETVSGGPYAITQGTLAASNYKITFTGSTLTITPAPLTVTANPQTKVYGTADPTLTDTATGFVDTTVDGVTIDDTAATALTGELARTPGETVSGGPYAITQGTLAASNYTITFTGSTLTITPATLTITANPQTKVYGTDDPALTDTATGFVHTTVDGAAIDDTAATVLTGQLARTPGETVSGGPYEITQGTLAASSNYTISFTGNTLTITPAPLTITASPQTKVYGTDDPALTDTATGFVHTTVDGAAIDDTAATVLTGQLARTSGETVSGDPYAITQGTLAADSNYTLSFTGSTLAITPATLNVTANPQTKVYGTADPRLTDGVTGLVDTTVDGVMIDDTAATVLTGALARAEAGTVAGEQAGGYAITQGTLAANSNYTIQFNASNLTISPATPTVSVLAPGGVYTGSRIAAQATVAGTSGTSAASLEGVSPALTYYVGSGTSGTSLGSTPPIQPGTYTVVASFPDSADYVASQSLPVTFTIGKAAPTIALVPSVESSVFGQSVTLTASIAFDAAVPGGSVTFYDGSTALGTAAVNASGKAMLATAALGVGIHSLTASYAGDSDFASSVSKASEESVSASRHPGRPGPAAGVQAQAQPGLAWPESPGPADSPGEWSAHRQRDLRDPEKGRKEVDRKGAGNRRTQRRVGDPLSQAWRRARQADHGPLQRRLRLHSEHHCALFADDEGTRSNGPTVRDSPIQPPPLTRRHRSVQVPRHRARPQLPVVRQRRRTRQERLAATQGAQGLSPRSLVETFDMVATQLC